MTVVFIYSSQSSAPLQREGLSGLEDDLDDFLGAAGEVTGSGMGTEGWNIDLELAAGTDVENWLGQIAGFLQEWGVPEDTYLVISAGQEGTEPRRLPVFQPKSE